MVLTSRSAVDPSSYPRGFDAIGIAFAGENGVASRPTRFAQLVAAGTAASDPAVLLITSEIDGDQAADSYPSASISDATAVDSDARLQLVAFPTVADSSLRAPQTIRSSEATGVAVVGGQPDMIETDAQLASGEAGGAAFAGERLIGLLVPAPGDPNTAAVRPVAVARPLLERAMAMLEPAAGQSSVSLELREALPPPTYEFTVRATVEGMPDGSRWSWSCVGPDGRELAAAWPPVLVWNAGRAPAEIELRCVTADGFELAAGDYDVEMLSFGDAGNATVVGTSAVVVESPAEPDVRGWRANELPPAFEIAIPTDFRCSSCASPYELTGLLVLDLFDRAGEDVADGQLALRTMFGTEHESVEPLELLAALEGPGTVVTERQQEIEFAGHPAARVEITFSEEFTGSGPFEGARFLPGTRGWWTAVSVDGVAFVISAETWETEGWEQRLTRMDEISRSLRFP